jgi:hypothetical protein
MRYKELFKPMNFDPCNRLLKIQESIRSLTPKMEAHLCMCRFILSHSSTLPRTWNVTSMLHFWPTPLQALALVVSPKLKLRQWLWPIKKLFFKIVVCVCSVFLWAWLLSNLTLCLLGRFFKQPFKVPCGLVFCCYALVVAFKVFKEPLKVPCGLAFLCYA